MSKARILGAVAVGIGAWLLTRFIFDIPGQHRKHLAKKFTKDALQTWDGEGGTSVFTTQVSAAAAE